MIQKILKIFFLNIFIFGVGLIFIEIAWHYLYKNDIRYSVNVLADTSYVYDVSSIYKSDNSIISYNRDRNGFRGEYASIEDIDILAVGGSTTDQRYIDDSKDWVFVLQETLNSNGANVTAVNAGVDGQSSFGHIKNFDLWFSKLESLHPKYILFYVGLNDFYKDANYTYDDLATSEKKLAASKTIKRIIKSSFSYYLFRLTKGLILTNINSIGHSKLNFQTLNTTTNPLLDQEEYKPLMTARLKQYANRLEILASRSKSIGAIPIFITQRRMSYWIVNEQITGITDEALYDGVKYNGVDIYYMTKLLNETTKSICSYIEYSKCIDLESELEFEYEDFYDIAHNTPSGASKIGKYLAGKMKLIQKK